MTITIDKKAWDEGFRAGERRDNRCPYPRPGTEGLSWWSGYIEGDAKRQGFSHSQGQDGERKDRP